MDNTKKVIGVFDRMAGVYQDKFMDISLYHDTLNSFCELILKGANLLEIACGPGNITRYLLTQRPDLKILGTDLAPNMLQLAKANNPAADFKLMDAREINALSGTYDAVACGFILPYLSETEAEQLIVDAFKLLNAGGVMYISTMEENEENVSGIRTSSAGDQMYMYYHKADSLANDMIKAGFTIEDLQRKEYAGADGSKTTDLIMIAKK